MLLHGADGESSVRKTSEEFEDSGTRLFEAASGRRKSGSQILKAVTSPEAGS